MFEKKVTLVIHDWGSALGFHWAHRHPQVVKGIAYMEAIVRPLPWDDWPIKAVMLSKGLRSEGGEKMVLEKNFFVEKLLPHAILRTLDEAEMAEYRRPFLEPGESRRPTLTWPRKFRSTESRPMSSRSLAIMRIGSQRATCRSFC